MENDYRIYSTRDKSYWGPIYWDFLYLTIMGFPVTLKQEQSREFSNLLLNFHIFIPCADCRQHYKREIKKINLNIKNKNDAMDAVIHLHNKVRIRQKKKILTSDGIISYHYRKSSNINKFLYIFSIFVVFIIFRHIMDGVVG